MIIQDILEVIVSNMDANGDSFDFTFESYSWKNLGLDEQPLPAVHLKMPLEGKPKILAGGSIEYEYNCVLSFMYASDLDDNPDEHSINLLKSINALSQFVLMCEADVDNIDSSKTDYGGFLQFTAHEMYDRCVDGVSVQIKFVPAQRPSACIPSYSIPVGPCDPATVQNQSGLFSQLIASGDTFVLSSNNYSINNTEGTVVLSGTVEAQTDILGTVPDINFTDSTGVTTQEASGKDLACTLAPPLTYGLVDFDTLDSNNPFGNTNRRTDLLGTQVYADGIFIDWYSRRGSEVFGYPTNVIPSPDVYTSQADAITYCDNFILSGFSDWRMSEKSNIDDLAKSQMNAFDYAPINLSGAQIYWIDISITPTMALVFRTDNFSFYTQTKTVATGKPLPVRTFTVTGTTLS
jgi:hypothetical protein